VLELLWRRLRRRRRRRRRRRAPEFVFELLEADAARAAGVVLLNLMMLSLLVVVDG
jgi:hypothetical protein